MAYAVSEYHRHLRDEGNRLLDRVGMERPAHGGAVPGGDGYLLLVPIMHIILDRLDALGRQELAGWQEREK